ncbi:lymphocyte activation gene 3 protein isoform X2 [Hippocampus comes]|uniref:lymphocyte activation gene 3 protein isoform X2 n=1 Tax=Hippocampus comes TaxID=109280 RepID=UPI00094E7A3F|nr:PREDICTED: lymphocyte activation gene 3 protein-like isoform X2 [Hippocampus comes]
MRTSKSGFALHEARHELQEMLAESNSQVLLPCDCNSSSSIAITWTKDHQGTVWRQERSGLQFWGSRWLQKGQQRVRCPRCQLQAGDCGLRISDVREKDGGRYACKFQSGGQIITRRLVLRVIKVSFYPVAPVAGVHVSINCSVTPRPQGATVQWRVNNGSFAPSSGASPPTPRWSLQEKASVRLAGEWMCVVASGDAQGRASAALTVRGIVHPSRDATKVYAAVGSGATLPCVFSPGSNPSKPTWQKLQAGSLWRPASFSSSPPASQPAWDHSARFKETALEDEGTYRCGGVVEGHSLSRKVQLVVATIERSVTWKKALTLTCQLTDTSEVTRYQWVRVTHDASGKRRVETVQEGKNLRVSDVSHGDAGEWACRFFGERGLLGNVTQGIGPPLDHASGSAGVSPSTSVALGVSALLLLLLLLLARMYKNHQRRKRILQYTTLESILHARSKEREAKDPSRVKKWTPLQT